MSSLWTPDGERPVRRDTVTVAEAAAQQAVDDGGNPNPDEVRAMQEELRSMTEELVQVPASAIVANHCIGFFQLAAAHLQREIPNLVDAQVAIDAMSSVVDGLKGRLGPDEGTLVDALAQIRMAYVQVSASLRS